MRVYSLAELFCMTRSELFALHAQITAGLSALPDAERPVALGNLRQIRRVLAHLKLAPRR